MPDAPGTTTYHADTTAYRADTTPAAPCPPAGSPGSEYTGWNLPRWGQGRLAEREFAAQYELFTGLNPFFVIGYFDADTLPDLAVQVREVGGGRRGVAIFHRASGQVHVLGAGTPLGNGGDDWSWLWVWRVEDPTGPDPARQGRQLLLVEKPESASGYLWWDGTNYQWTQGSD